MIDNAGQHKLCIPPSLEHQVLQLAHDTQNHAGIERTYQNARAHYFFRNMLKKVKSCVSTCDSCLRSKNRTHQEYGLLKWVRAPVQPWGLVTLDFIVKLPPMTLEGEIQPVDTILTATCKTTRAARFITGREDWDAPRWARRFFTATYPDLGAPGGIISDRGSIFISAFWTTFFEKMNTQICSTTAHNPRANGASEHTNKEIEIAIRHLVNANQSDWAEVIPHVQLAFNNARNEATGYSPNQLLLGFNPNTALQLTVQSPETTEEEEVEVVPTEGVENDSQHKRRQRLAAQSRIEELTAMRAEAQDALTYSQFAVAKFFDHKHAPPPEFKVGDQAYINIAKKDESGYHMAGVNCQKLAPRRIGPYTVLEILAGGRAVKLELPPSSSIWPIISCIHLEKVPPNVRGPTQPPPVEIQDGEASHQEFEVEQIIQRRTRNNTIQYLVKWVGYPFEQATWEPRAHLDNAAELIAQYEASTAPLPASPRRRK